jgi:hypothetical protein
MTNLLTVEHAFAARQAICGVLQGGLRKAMLRGRVADMHSWRAVPLDWRIAELLLGYAIARVGIPVAALPGVRIDWRAAKLSFVGSLVAAPWTLWCGTHMLPVRLWHRRSGSRTQVAPLACLA